MIYLKSHTAIGGFVLVTALLAGTTIGRAMGISLGEALCLSVVTLIGIASIANRLMLRHQHDMVEE